MAFTFTQNVGETVRHFLDVTGMLDPDDTITGTITAIGNGALTVGNIQTNVTIEKVGGQRVEIGNAIIAEISGGANGVTYNVQFEFDTVDGAHRFTNTPIDITVETDPS